jgi:excisionase family DNA binding protein
MDQSDAISNNGFTDDNIFLTPVEAMKILRVKRSTFYRYLQQGIIPSVRLGHQIRIRKENVLNLGNGPISLS